MPGATPPAANPSKPCQWQAPWGEFANWAAQRVDATLEFTGNAYRLVPRGDQAAEVAQANAGRGGLGAALKSSLRIRRPASEGVQSPEFASPAELAKELLARLASVEHPADLAPEQPERVHDLAPKLIKAYTVKEGRLHIAGCHFEDVPFLRFTRVTEVDGEVRFEHTLLDAGGRPVSEELAEQLKLKRAHELEHRPATTTDTISPPQPPPAGTVLSGVVWAKWVSGSVQFSINDATLNAPFESWANTFAAPPVTCPQTGVQTFHLRALSDGSIAAAEEVAECAESGRAMLRRDLVLCSVTGKRVAADLCDACPVLGEPSLRDKFTICQRCGERVSQAAMAGRVCAACLSMKRTPGTDASLLAILAAYPTLERLGRWRLAETKTAYLLRGSRLGARYLFVFDRIDLGVRRAVKLGLLGGTAELKPVEKLALLGQ